MKKSNKSMMLMLVLIFAVVVIAGISSTQNLKKSDTEKSYDKAISYIDKYMRRIKVDNATPIKSTVEFGTTKLADELPDISSYPLSVEGKGEINVEIFSSPEKAGEGTDGWLNEVAEKYNREKNTINGKVASVSVRSIASGAAVDYIVSGKYVPEAFSPSNELWAKMIQAQHADLELVDTGIAKNAPGILLSQSTYDALNQKYGKVDLDVIVEATINNEIAINLYKKFGFNLVGTRTNYYKGVDALLFTLDI